MAELFTLEVTVAALVVLLAGVIRGFSGFGGALTMAPPLSLLFGPATAVATVVLLDFAATIMLFGGAVRVARWREIVPIGVAAVLAVPVGGMMLLSFDDDVTRRAIALGVGVFAILLLTGWRYRGNRNPAAGIAVGLASGFLNGATSLGGPPVVLYQLAGVDGAAVSRAHFITFFAFIDGAAILFFLLEGILDVMALSRAALLLPTLAAGVWLGGRLFRRSDELAFRRIVLVFLLFVALATLIA